MNTISVYDEAFRCYGRVLEGIDTEDLCRRMEAIPLPESGVSYVPSIEDLEKGDVFSLLRDGVYGGLPIQIGMCSGFNTKLNCLEYHRTNEINIGAQDFVLLLAKQEEICKDFLHTDCVIAVTVPRGTVVELFSDTLHYAPCRRTAAEGFRVAVALPRGTNTARPKEGVSFHEDCFLTAQNKWLLAHPESDEAKRGCAIGLAGMNIDLEKGEK